MIRQILQRSDKFYTDPGLGQPPLLIRPPLVGSSASPPCPPSPSSPPTFVAAGAANLNFVEVQTPATAENEADHASNDNSYNTSDGQSQSVTHVSSTHLLHASFHTYDSFHDASSTYLRRISSAHLSTHYTKHSMRGEIRMRCARARDASEIRQRCVRDALGDTWKDA